MRTRTRTRSRTRTRRKMSRPKKKVSRTKVTRKRVQNTRKRGGAALDERGALGQGILIQPWPKKRTITPKSRVAKILKGAGEDFAPRPDLPRHDVIEIFTDRPETNLRDAIAAVNYIKGLSRSANEEDQLLYKIITSFSQESEHREWLNNRGLDYQSLRQLLKLIDNNIDNIPDFKFPLVLTKFYQFFVLHKQGVERERGLELFKAGAKRMLRNAITMAKGLSKGPKTTAPMVLYRGLNISYEEYEKSRMNDSYQRGFSSTSLNERSSKLFVRGGFMMRIHVPVGTPISCYGLYGEFEIPLPIGCKFVVRKDEEGNVMGTRDPDDGMLYIDFDLVLSDGGGANGGGANGGGANGGGANGGGANGGGANGGGGDGISEIERKYEALSEKIDELTEEQLTKVFRRSYEDYRGPGSENWRKEESSSGYNSDNRLSNVEEYLDPESQELISMAEQHKRGREHNLTNSFTDPKKSKEENSYDQSIDLSKYDPQLVGILGTNTPAAENGAT